MAHAVAGLHAAQLVHHDLRPANLLVDPDGRVSLVSLRHTSPRAPDERSTGEGMPAEALALAERHGVPDAAAHVARLLDESLIREADLVLGLAREHRRAVVELVPAATRKTFTLREFAHLAASVTDADLADAASSPFAEPVEANPTLDARLREAVVAAASLRGVVVPFESPDDA